MEPKFAVTVSAEFFEDETTLFETREEVLEFLDDLDYDGVDIEEKVTVRVLGNKLKVATGDKITLGD